MPGCFFSYLRTMIAKSELLVATTMPEMLYFQVFDSAYCSMFGKVIQARSPTTVKADPSSGS